MPARTRPARRGQDGDATTDHRRRARALLEARAPAYAMAFRRLCAATEGSSPLTARERALILLAVNASVTHLHGPATAEAIAAALEAGASEADIVETLTVISGLGVHACTLGVPVLVDEFRKAGRAAEVERPLGPRQTAVKEMFIAERGYWSDFWEETLRLAPDWFEAYGDLSAVPWREGHLAPKLKEFLYIAVDAATTHLYEPGLRAHYRNAMQYGATAEEMVAVLTLISQMGIESALAGLPLLEAALRQRKVAAKGVKPARAAAAKRPAKSERVRTAAPRPKSRAR